MYYLTGTYFAYNIPGRIPVGLKALSTEDSLIKELNLIRYYDLLHFLSNDFVMKVFNFNTEKCCLVSDNSRKCMKSDLLHPVK